MVHNCSNDWKDELLKNRRVKKPDGVELNVERAEEYGDYLVEQIVKGTDGRRSNQQFDMTRAPNRVFGDVPNDGSVNIVEQGDYWYAGYSRGSDDSLQQNVPQHLKPAPTNIHYSWGNIWDAHHSDNAAINEIFNHQGTNLDGFVYGRNARTMWTIMYSSS